VAGRWRIRHKLMLGLGLVVAIMALLVAGTLKGLTSYRATMRAMDRKLVELNVASSLLSNIFLLKNTADTGVNNTEDINRVEAQFTDQKERAEKALALYKQTLLETMTLEQGAGNEFNEKEQAAALENGCAALNRAWEQAGIKTQSGAGQGETKSLRLTDREVSDGIEYLVRTCGDLINCINNNLFDRITKARADFRISLASVLSTMVVGILLTAYLLRFFYRWVLYPIRDLEQGAGRVAQGDFDHRIEVHSGDEIEDLAAAFNDMTGRLREMYRDLARQVNERSRQLVRSERLAGVGFLAAGVAHEINNPLASIAFCSEALERRLADVLAYQAEEGAMQKEDRETAAKYLKMIQQEAFRCKEITQRLLEFSRGGERRREPTDLAELTQGVLDVAQHLQNCRGKQLLFEPAAPVVAWVNAQEIKSVVLNLVVNALDSMDDGGVLRITLGQRDGMAELVFSDTGCGMSPEILENIFEPFFTRSRTGKGTGLGLSISHRIINQHGGEIEAASPGPHQGSTFTVRVPLQVAEPVPPAAENGGAEYPIFPARALELPRDDQRGRAAA
jgi:signal transduction histidine kinase